MYLIPLVEASEAEWFSLAIDTERRAIVGVNGDRLVTSYAIAVENGE